MKKLYIIVVILIISIFFLLCIRNLCNDTIDLQEDSKLQLKDEISRVIFFENEVIYKNEMQGYQVTFPENWRGHFVVTEYCSGEVCIGFYGKSQTGQLAYKKSLGRDGLDIGWIVKQVPEEGSLLLGALGTVDGSEYFITTARGGTYLPELQAVLDPNSTSHKLAKYNIDETEISLIKQDLEIAPQMWDDFYTMNFKFEEIT